MHPEISDQAEDIKGLIPFLVRTILPAEIYRIRHAGAASSENDCISDLIIVMAGQPAAPFHELEQVVNIACSQYKVVSCYFIHEGCLLKCLQNGHIHYAIHCRPKNLVYDNKVLSYPVKPDKELAEIKQKARQLFYRHFKKAEEFYACAEVLFQKNRSTLVMFMLHQATELTFIAILLCLTGYEKRTHEIRVLIKQTRRFAPD